MRATLNPGMSVSINCRAPCADCFIAQSFATLLIETSSALIWHGPALVEPELIEIISTVALARQGIYRPGMNKYGFCHFGLLLSLDEYYIPSLSTPPNQARLKWSLNALWYAKNRLLCASLLT